MPEGEAPRGIEQEVGDLTPVEEMDKAAIEAELKSRDFPTPGRWFFYETSQQQDFLQKVRDGVYTLDDEGKIDYGRETATEE